MNEEYIPHLHDLYKNANRHINDLYMWFRANKLSLNTGKTKYIVLRQKHIKQNLSQHKINIGDTILSRIGNDCVEKTTKFLNWHALRRKLQLEIPHYEVNKKVSRALFAIKQVKKILPTEA